MNTPSVITSWMIFNWATDMPACWNPIRLAGTCNRYSNKALPQLTLAATYQGAVARFFRCPYHAMVMKTLDAISSRMVCSDKGREASAVMAGLSGTLHADDHLLVFD